MDEQNIWERVRDSPYEIRWAVLAASADLRCLRAAAQSCSALWEVFRAEERSLVNSVMDRLVPQGLMSAVSLVLRCPTGPRTSLEDYMEDTERVLRGASEITTIRWTGLRQALAATRLHGCVRRLTGMFVWYCLHEETDWPRPALLGGLMPPIEEEKERVVRILYVTEVYCRLYAGMVRDGFPGGVEDLGDVDGEPFMAFFSGFAPWEGLQMLSVFIFLLSRLRVGLEAIEDAGGPPATALAAEYFLSFGLEDLCARLDGRPCAPPPPIDLPRHRTFLYDAMHFDRFNSVPYGPWAEDGFFPDPDGEAKAIWKHWNPPSATLLAYPSTLYRNRWGYLMWSRERYWRLGSPYLPELGSE